MCTAFDSHPLALLFIVLTVVVTYWGKVTIYQLVE